MIQAIIYRNKKHHICGFQLSGHAGYAEEGQDIVCAAVTVLTLNTVNALEQFTKTEFQCEADESQGGFLSVCFPKIKEGAEDRDAQLLLKTMVLGLENIEQEYGRYITLNNREV